MYVKVEVASIPLKFHVINLCSHYVNLPFYSIWHYIPDRVKRQIEVPCLLCLFITVCAPCNSGKLVLQIDLVLLNPNLLIFRKRNHGLPHLTCFFSKGTHSYLSLFATNLINHWRYIKKRRKRGEKDLESSLPANGEKVLYAYAMPPTDVWLLSVLKTEL